MAVRSDTPVYPVPWTSGRVASWVTTVDHKRIGILYIWTSLFFFLVGGALAGLMRAQLARPNEDLIVRNSYNEVLTMHGTIMIFLFVVPIWAGFANFLVPLMIGARDMAFPRLNAFGYWMFALGVRPPYSRWTDAILNFLRDVCEPYLKIFRRFIPAIGMFDFSPIIAIILST